MDQGIQFDFKKIDRPPDSGLITGVFHDALKHDEQRQTRYPTSISTGGAGGVETVSFCRLKRDQEMMCIVRDPSGDPHLEYSSRLRVLLKDLIRNRSLNGFWVRSQKGVFPALKVGSYFHDSEMCLTRSQSRGVLEPPLQNDIIQIKYHSSRNRKGWFYRRLKPSNKEGEHFFIAPDCYFVKDSAGKKKGIWEDT